MLGDLEDRFNSLEEGSRGMVDQVSQQLYSRSLKLRGCRRSG